MDSHQAQDGHPQYRRITGEWSTPNAYRTYELNAAELQSDVDWYNHHFESLNLTPKFTKGQQYHPYHPKRFIHDHIDKVIRSKWENPGRLCTIKVSVDCIDDTDFVSHLIHASHQGVLVQCIVDWRKMTLTNSQNYARLKRARLELIGVFCTPQHHLIEVEPDMHTKFVIFNDEDCILGSFNITFDRWWANWESGMTFHLGRDHDAWPARRRRSRPRGPSPRRPPDARGRWRLARSPTCRVIPLSAYHVSQASFRCSASRCSKYFDRLTRSYAGRRSSQNVTTSKSAVDVVGRHPFAEPVADHAVADHHHGLPLMSVSRSSSGPRRWRSMSGRGVAVDRRLHRPGPDGPAPRRPCKPAVATPGRTPRGSAGWSSRRAWEGRAVRRARSA